MEPNAVHVVMRPRNDRVIAPTLGERRLVARTLLNVGRDFQLLGFGLPDNHLHPVLAEIEARAREFARRAAIALTKKLRLPGGFATPHLEPIHTASHLQNALRYAIGQSERHGARGDPDFEGTNLPDLLGLRPLGRFTADVVRRWLPRLGDTEILSWAGLERLEPADGPVSALRQAAEAALARPRLEGSDRQVVAVRRAVVHLAEAWLTDAEIGRLLEISERSVRRLRARKPDEDWVQVLRLQLGWLTRPGRRALPTGPFAVARAQPAVPFSSLAADGSRFTEPTPLA